MRFQNACPPLSPVQCSCNDARPSGSYATEKYSDVAVTGGVRDAAVGATRPAATHSAAGAWRLFQ